MFVVLGRYKDGEEEQVDQAETQREAEFLLGEYQVAYGRDWTLRISEQGEADWRKLLPEFLAWWEEIDEDRCLSDFDLALGWFSGKGCSHDEALEAAECVRDEHGGTP